MPDDIMAFGFFVLVFTTPFEPTIRLVEVD
jgi:hypothetical protein